MESNINSTIHYCKEHLLSFSKGFFLSSSLYRMQRYVVKNHMKMYLISNL